MFTGLTLKMGKFIALEHGSPPELAIDIIDGAGFERVRIGDSVAVNGACLTVVAVNGAIYRFNLSRETLRLSNFADLSRGGYVNLELPLTLQDFLGGHLVSGHLDGVARVRSSAPSGGGARLSLVYREREWRRFIINKGSVTLNGVSLTVSEIKSSYFSVEVIPHTLASTNLKYLRVGERVNLELDLLGKYLYNLVKPGAAQGFGS